MVKRMKSVLENFKVIFSSKEKIREFRGFILNLAFQGRLAPQDPDDEPVRELIKMINQEKEKLIRENKIKRSASVPAISENEFPFGLPKGWEWIRLRDTSYNLGQKTPNGNFHYIDVGSIDNLSGKLNKGDNILTPEEAPSRARKIVAKGSVIYSTVRPYLLNVAIIEREFDAEPIASTAFAVMHPYKGINNKYLFYYLRSGVFTQYVMNQMVGLTYPAINDEKLFKGLFPLPPTSEQHRIVQKVDKLMVLCDELEEALEKKDYYSVSASKSLANILSRNDTQGKANEAIKLLVNNFKEVYNSKENIKDLKDVFIELAIQGKVVPQKSTDEPASVLLKNIKQEKERLIKEKRIRKSSSLPITKEEIPFGLPRGWEWTRLSEVVSLLGDGLHGTPMYSNDGNYYFINGNNLKDGSIIIKNETKKVAFEEYEKYKKVLNDKTVLVSINGTLGNVAFYNNERIVLGKSACYFNLLTGVSKQFIKILIESKYFLNYAFENSTGTTIKNLSLKAMNNFLLPIPPLPEQLRIVKRVEEFITLCNELGKHIEESEKTNNDLVKAVLNLL